MNEKYRIALISMGFQPFHHAGIGFSRIRWIQRDAVLLHHMFYGSFNLFLILSIAAAEIFIQKTNLIHRNARKSCHFRRPARCISRYGDPDDLLLSRRRFLPGDQPTLGHAGPTGVKDLPEIDPVLLLPLPDLFISSCISLPNCRFIPLSGGISIDIIRMISLFSQICKCLFHRLSYMGLVAEHALDLHPL